MAADYLLGSFERRKQERELKKEIARREAEARRLEAKQDGENAYNRMRQQGMDERSIEQTAFQNAMQKVQDQRASQDRLRRSFTEARNFRQGQQAQFVQQGYL
jgi:predicted Fe-Mo cluster-binding NifX family protein